VALDPIWVNFNVNEQDVLRIREEARRRGMTADDLRQLPVEVGCRPNAASAQGQARLCRRTLNQSTGTLPVRGVLPNSDRALLPGFFVRVRVPIDQRAERAVRADVALGSDQAGRYLLVVNGENVVEQRKVRVGPLEGEAARHREGLKPDDRVVTAGLLRAIPRPEGRSATEKNRSAAGVGQVGAGHDFEILHRAAGSFQRHRDPDDPDRRRLPVPARRRAVSRRRAADGAGHHRYPGASAKTVIDTVALPIEQQVNGVEDMLYMQSYAAPTAPIR
jgi:hypothetical protein